MRRLVWVEESYDRTLRYAAEAEPRGFQVLGPTGNILSTNPGSIVEWGYPTNPDGSIEGGVLPVSTVTQYTYKDPLDDYYTASNDATVTSSNVSPDEQRTVNPHLQRMDLRGRTAEDAKNEAIGAVAPLAIPAGIAASGLAGGLAASAAANATTLAAPSVPTLASYAWWPYADAALTSAFGAKGIRDIADGKANWETALDIAPLAQLYKPVMEGGRMAAASKQLLQKSASKKVASERPSLVPLGNDAEQGRTAFLQDISSPWYRERWINEGVNESDADEIINHMYKSAESVPFDYSKTMKELDGARGVADPKPKWEWGYKKDKRGNTVDKINEDTGIDVFIASDSPRKSETAYTTPRFSTGFNFDLK